MTTLSTRARCSTWGDELRLIKTSGLTRADYDSDENLRLCRQQNAGWPRRRGGRVPSRTQGRRAQKREGGLGLTKAWGGRGRGTGTMAGDG